MKRLFLTLPARETSDFVFGEHRVYDARALDDRIRKSQIGHEAILLASTAGLAPWTAQSIKDSVGIKTIVRHQFIGKVGMNPAPVEFPRSFVEEILKRSNIEHTDRDVVAITHEPLVRLAAGRVLEQGQIYAVGEDWRNPAFDQAAAYLLENPEQWL